MSEAMDLAREAARQGEVPVGAVVVKNDEIVGTGFNRNIELNDPSAHAEILAMREAGPPSSLARSTSCSRVMKK